MCEVLKISPKTYYKYRNIKDKDYEDYKLIKRIFNKSLRTYGYRRVTSALEVEYSILMNHKKVLRIMNKYNIMPEYAKTINYGRRYIKENISADLIQRDFNQRGWATDVTYLMFGNKRAYLSTILDLQTRNIVSYEISKRNDNELVIKTLNKAIHKTKDLRGLIIHSDQGFQYLSNEYKKICESNGILVSMSRKGTPLDNAVIESFHSLLKKETLYNNDIKNIDEYIELVKRWLKFYNNSRIRQKK